MLRASLALLLAADLSAIVKNLHVGADPNPTGTLPNRTPVPLSAQVTTLAPKSLLIFAMDVDWQPKEGTLGFSRPAGWDSLVELTDRGTGTNAQWSSQMIACHIQAVAGPTESFTASMTNDANNGTESSHGAPWGGIVAVSPQL